MARRKRVAAVAAVGAVVFGAGAITAVAAVPGGDGVIHACRSNPLGTIRVIDTDAGQRCRAGEKPLDWNQTGPPGPAGEAGPSTPPASLTAADAGFVRVTGDAGFQPVLRIDLPAGSWALVAKGYVEVFPSDRLKNNTTCDLAQGAFIFDRSEVRDEAANTVVPVALTNVVTLQSGGTVELRCSTNVLSDINDTKIVAIAVSPS